MPTTTVGEIHLYYEQNGEGEPLILIPGFAAGIWIWFRQTQALGQDFQVVTFDPRGVARSDKPEGPQTIRLIADDVPNLLMAFTPEFICEQADQVEEVVRLRTANHVPEHAYLSQLQAAIAFNAADRVGEIKARTLV